MLERFQTAKVSFTVTQGHSLQDDIDIFSRFDRTQLATDRHRRMDTGP